MSLKNGTNAKEIQQKGLMFRSIKEEIYFGDYFDIVSPNFFAVFWSHDQDGRHTNVW